MPQFPGFAPTGQIQAPQAPVLRSFDDAVTLRTNIYDNVLKAAQSLPPIANKRNTLRLSNVQYVDPETYSRKRQKEAILTGETLGRRLRGTWELMDASGAVLDRRDQILARVPFVSDAGTIIHNGSKYTVNHQQRPRPGVYTRIKANGELEAAANLAGRGLGHRYFLDPAKGMFGLKVGQSEMPLAPLLYALGATHEELQDAWGPEIYASNGIANSPTVVKKLVQRLARSGEQIDDEDHARREFVAGKWRSMELDPDVMQRTLGQPFKNLDKDAVLAITKKLLAVSRKEQDPDDRDNLLYQQVMGPEDLLAERITKDYGRKQKQILFKVGMKGNLQSMPSGALTEQLESLLLGSGLGMNLEEINPLEILDKQGRITKMGEGGIANPNAIPETSRGVSSSHFGYIDPIRTPECHSADTEVLTGEGWKKWPAVTMADEFFCLLEDGSYGLYETDFRRATKISTYNYEGSMYGGHGHDPLFPSNMVVDYLVTPEHRMRVKTKGDRHWRIEQAAEIHGTEFEVQTEHDEQHHCPVVNKTWVEDYKGVVYCASVPGGWLFVRRKGSNGFWCGNSMRAGVDLQLARGARKGPDGKLYTPLRNLQTGQVDYKTIADVADEPVAFPGALKDPRWRARVPAMIGGKVDFVPRDQVRYEQQHFEDSFSPLANLVPLKSGIKGQRLAMASRMMTQALPLERPEAPLVQSGVPGTGGMRSFEEEYAKHAGAIHARQAGQVLGVSDEGLQVKYADGTRETVELDKNTPFNRKTYLSSKPLVQPGQVFQPGQVLAGSNYTDDKGVTAVGLNLRTAFLPWQGLDTDDAIVISESAAKKLRSEHLYQHELELTDKHKTAKRDFVSLFPATYGRPALDKLDDDGVIQPGQTIEFGEPLILAAKEKELSQNKIHRKRQPGFQDASVIWEHHDPGVVTDVHKGKAGPVVMVKSMSEMGIADKLSGRFGNKGVVSSIIPDAKMPHDHQGNPMEVLIAPDSIISRTNPAFMLENLLGKAAAKRGAPYKVEDFGEIQDLSSYADAELRRQGLTAAEDLIDPNNESKIPGVSTGVSFWMKLHHLAESKGQGRGGGSYSSENEPTKGGSTGAKRLSMMETNALLSAGGTEVLRDARSVRGQKNEDYWLQFMQGHTPAEVKVPFAYEKFVNRLKGAGINVVKEGPRLNLMALTNNDVRTLTGGSSLENAETVRYDRGLEPVPGGLFDPKLTGGHGGCFHSSTLIWTESGMIPIGQIVSERLKVRVWTYNWQTAVFELKPVTNWFCNFSDNGIGRMKFDAPFGRLGSRLSRFNPSTLWGTDTHQVYTSAGEKVDLAAARTLLAVTERLSYTQEQFLYGGLLGDLHVGSTGSLAMTHASKQRSYLELKLEILGALATLPRDYLDLSGGCMRLKVQAGSRAHASFRKARELCYVGRRKTISVAWLDKIGPMALAVWLMDDGHVCRSAKAVTPAINLATHAFSKMEVEMLREMLDKKWRIMSWVGRDEKKYAGRDIGWYIMIAGQHADKFLDLIAPYCISSMQYKLGSEPEWGRCKKCSSPISPRRRFCNRCQIEKAASCGEHKLPKDVRRLFGGTCALREIIRSSVIPPDEYTAHTRWRQRMQIAGSAVDAMRADNSPTLCLREVSCRYTHGTGLEWDKYRTVYDIEVAENHNYFANGILVSNSKWSSIKLPEPLPSPVFEEPIRRLLGLTEEKFHEVLAGKREIPTGTGPSAISKALENINVDRELAIVRVQAKGGSKTSRDEAIRKLGYLKTLKRLDLRPKDWMLSHVPVLPTAFRPVSVMEGGTPLVDDINALYRDLFEAGDNFKKMKEEVGEKDLADERLAVYQAFKAVTGLGDPITKKSQEKGMRGILRSVFGSTPKFGVVQRSLLSSNMDNVARGVVIPNPDLDIDSVGFPEQTAFDVYKRFLARRFKRKGMPLAEALRHIEDKSPLARDMLLEEMNERPVLVSRAPTLHKFGIMAFRPTLVKGNAIHVNPLVNKGFGLDYDGDQMNIHVPASTEAASEMVARLLPSRNLISPADFKTPMMMPSQTYALGLYLASTAKSESRPHVFRSREDALAAYRRGELRAGDNVRIQE